MSPGSWPPLPVRLKGKRTRSVGTEEVPPRLPAPRSNPGAGEPPAAAAPPSSGTLFSSPKKTPWAPRGGGVSRGFLGVGGGPWWSLSLGLGAEADRCPRTGLTLSVPSPPSNLFESGPLSPRCPRPSPGLGRHRGGRLALLGRWGCGGSTRVGGEDDALRAGCWGAVLPGFPWARGVAASGLPPCF